MKILNMDRSKFLFMHYQIKCKVLQCLQILQQCNIVEALIIFIRFFLYNYLSFYKQT